MRQIQKYPLKMENHELIKYEVGLIQRVGNLISITSKLLSRNQNYHIQLYDYEKYKHECLLNNEFTEFIKENFWYFLNGIILKSKK